MRFSNFSVFTLGCKINQYETQAIKEKWESHGIRYVEDISKADVIIINTCAVTDRAIQDVRKVVRRFVRKNPYIKVILTGCAVTVFKDELRHLPNIYELVPQEEKVSLLCPWDRITELSRLDFKISDFPRARPVVKIQDGCSHFCSYCIVPYTRGKPKTRNADDIFDEIQGLIKKGFKEIVLSGINLGQFDCNGRDLWCFLSWLEEKLYKDWSDSIRIRLSSLDPGMLSEEALRFIEKSRLLCRHLHISIQSGSPKILKLMRREHYSPLSIKKFVKNLEKVWDIFGLSGDFLVGFPYETEDDFMMTYRLCEELPFTHGHVFSFSPRPMTKANRMEHKVGWEEKKKRNKILRDLFEKKKKRFAGFLCERQISLDVIVEDISPFVGMSEYYIVCYSKGFENYRWGDRISVSPKKTFKDGVWVGLL